MQQLVRVDPVVLVFAIVVSMATAVVCGLVPVSPFIILADAYFSTDTRSRNKTFPVSDALQWPEGGGV